MEGEEFFIEKAEKYLTELPTQEKFHSVSNVVHLGALDTFSLLLLTLEFP